MSRLRKLKDAANPKWQAGSEEERCKTSMINLEMGENWSLSKMLALRSAGMHLLYVLHRQHPSCLAASRTFCGRAAAQSPSIYLQYRGALNDLEVKYLFKFKFIFMTIPMVSRLLSLADRALHSVASPPTETRSRPTTAYLFYSPLRTI